MSVDTVEFGERKRRFRWTPPNIGAVALALMAGGLGLALALAAELLPWMMVTPKGSIDPDFGSLTDLDRTIGLAQLVVWQAPAYYLTMTGLLATTAVLLLGRPAVRHGFAAAAVGCAASQAVLLAGLYTTTREGDTIFGSVGELRQRDLVEVATGLGFYSAVGAVILLAGAAVLGGWATFERKRRDTAEAAPEATAEEPRDLVVIPVESFERPAGNL